MITAATITTRPDGLLDVTATVDGATVWIAEAVHDPEAAGWLARDWNAGPDVVQPPTIARLQATIDAKTGGHR
jgi:hypothetical protein